MEWYIWAGWVIAYLIYLLIGDLLFITVFLGKGGCSSYCWELKYTFTVGIYLYLLHKLHTEVKEERMVGPAM